VIGGLASSEFPTILAVHRETESWKTLLLEPSAMRAPSLFRDPRVIDSRGSNLPAAIYRLEKQEDRPGRVRTAIVNRLSQLLEDVQDLRLFSDERTETWTVEVRGRDNIFHPAQSLSDGTLRFLVLSVLELDPELKGILCLEEPENGIHPRRIQAMIELLRGIAVDPSHPVDPTNPLRQVLVNTHSPLVVKSVRQDELVYLDEEQVTRNRQRGRVAVVRLPPHSWRAHVSGTSGKLAPGDLIDYLGNAADGWLAMNYYDKSNGESAPLHAGVRRAN
jgi:predicted ATPase